jgi:hypothetical protein
MMARSHHLAVAVLLTMLCQPVVAAERVAQFSMASASGVHTCKSDTDSGHTCIVTGSLYSNCIDAQSALRVQDCCPGTRACDRDPTTGATKCRKGGRSTAFRLLYCVGGF